MASADKETKERVASAAGETSHHERGLQAADEKTKENSERRLQSLN
ncbi:MAG: hypothetical protein JO297_14545 [Nitrososphaeraceae archaeon]|nr:hypothetical protein [Nitrososphaeraceae archaeon]